MLGPSAEDCKNCTLEGGCNDKENQEKNIMEKYQPRINVDTEGNISCPLDENSCNLERMICGLNVKHIKEKFDGSTEISKCCIVCDNESFCKFYLVDLLQKYYNFLEKEKQLKGLKETKMYSIGSKFQNKKDNKIYMLCGGQSQKYSLYDLKDGYRYGLIFDKSNKNDVILALTTFQLSVMTECNFEEEFIPVETTIDKQPALKEILNEDKERMLKCLRKIIHENDKINETNRLNLVNIYKLIKEINGYE